MFMSTCQRVSSQYPRVPKVQCLHMSVSYVVLSHFNAIALCLFIDSMAMGKLHKDIGHLIMQTAEDPEKSESQVVKVGYPKCTCNNI